MSHADIAIGLGVTGFVLMLFGLVVGIWVGSAGWSRKEKYSRVVWGVEIAASLLFIAAVWVAVSG